MSELINRSALLNALSALDTFVQDYIRDGLVTHDCWTWRGVQKEEHEE